MWHLPASRLFEPTSDTMGSELQKRVGQLFAVGFHGHTPSQEIRTLIHDYHVGGIVLFSRNFSSAEQLQALTSSLQNEAKLAGHERPLFIGIDQENGLVTRISPPIATQVPGPMALGATHDPKYAYEAGKITGETLSFFGINMNYAPVCDINSEPLNPVIGVRSPGDDPEFVGQFSSAAARGLREKNIIPSVKHFPGHGDTAVDSHYGLPVINKTRDQLERCELIPFRRAVAEGIETVMTAHISLPSIDEKLPATLSPTALGILRKDMGYDGVIITDCLEMEGIKSTIGSEKGAVLTIKAGSDSVMMCHTFDVHVASIKLVTEAAESGEIEKSRFDEACRRVAQLKDKFLNWDIALRVNDLNDLSEINKKSLVICQEAYENSVTVVRDEPSIIPLSSDSNVVFLFPGDNIPVGGAVDGEGMGRQGAYESATYFKLLQKHNQAITEIRYKEDGLKNEEWEVVEAADVVIFTSLNARESPYQESLGNELPCRTRALIAIAACSPYDFIEARDMTTYITTYEPTMEAFSVAADIIFGKKVPLGALPIGTKPSQRSHISVGLYNPTEDLEDMVSIWNAALPSYALPADSLRALISSSNQQHFVARVESRVVGFCLAYLNAFGPPTPVHIAAVAVLPEHQGRGIGSALLTEARSHFRSHFSTNSLKLGSNFPRFWPGIPRELSAKVQDFFVHRGFRLNPLSARSTDLYQDIRNFVSPEKYINRARERGFRFAPLRPQDYDECLIGQKKNFSYNAGWVEAYVRIHPSNYPSSVMTAFDSEGRQVGWTLMLSPEFPELNQMWAFPQICGEKTGLIGCVGVDAEHRKSGIGLALVCHAIENMKQRGIKGVFVDWVALDGWYEQVGFEVWRSYRPGEI